MLFVWKAVCKFCKIFYCSEMIEVTLEKSVIQSTEKTNTRVHSFLKCSCCSNDISVYVHIKAHLQAM